MSCNETTHDSMRGKKKQQPNTYYVAVLKVAGRGENKKKKKDLTEKACQSY